MLSHKRLFLKEIYCGVFKKRFKVGVITKRRELWVGFHKSNVKESRMFSQLAEYRTFNPDYFKMRGEIIGDGLFGERILSRRIFIAEAD